MSKELFGQAIVTSIASPATKYFAFAAPLQNGAENILVSKFMEQVLSTLSLTTTGSSGASTYIANVLNIPNYTLTGLGGVGGSGVANQIPYFSGTGTIAGDTALVWDNTTDTITFPKWKPLSNSTTALSLFKADGTTGIIQIDTVNNQIGIYQGTSNNGYAVEVNGTLKATTLVTSANTGLSASGLSIVNSSTTITSTVILRNLSTTIGNLTGIRNFNANNKIVSEILFKNEDHDGTNGSGSISFRTIGGTGTSAERMAIYKDGNVGIGITIPTTKLQISAGVAATAVYTKYSIPTTTGETASDGTNFGLDLDGNAIWNQLESTKTLNIQTNSVNRIVIDANGYIKIAQGLSDYASDALASAGGVPLNGLYRNGNSVQICLI